MKIDGRRFYQKPAYRAAMCEGKQVFPTKAAALLVRRERERRGTKGRHGALDAYRCHYCNQFHLGRRPKI